MERIWSYIHNKSWNTERKNHLFLFLTTLISSAIGFIIWYALHFFVLNKISWALCFTGYPGFFMGFFGGILYLFRHDFSDY